MKINKKRSKNNSAKKTNKEIKEDIPVDDDVVFQDETDEDGGIFKSPKDEIKKVKDKLNRCEKEKTEYLDGWHRAKSDLVNLKRRYEKSAEEAALLSERSFAEKLLPVFDSFSIAVSEQNNWEDLPDEWRVGMENIYNQLKKVLEDHGIFPFSPKGEQFDPSFHDALATETVREKNKDNVIVEVIQRGYIHKEGLLRSAKVKVAQYQEEESDKEDKEA